VRRLLIAAAVPLLGLLPASAGIPEYCGTSGLSEKQITECASAAEKTGNEKVGDIELIKTKFPFRMDLLGLRNEYNLSRPVEVNILSDDGTYLHIQYRNSSPFILIPRERIVRWSLGSDSSVDASGAIGATLGSVFFPPMLLAAPLGIRNVKTHQYQIQYIDEEGEPRSAVLTATLWHREILSALRSITGLRPNETRSDEDINSVQTAILKKLAEDRHKLVKSMLSTDTRKPWCQYIDFSKDEDTTKRFNRLGKQIDGISKRLKISPPAISEAASSETKWQEHLDKTRGLRQWAEANADAATKLKKCPAT